MDKWVGWLLPIAVSFISAFLTGMFMAGRNLEKLRVLEDNQKYQEHAIMELVERIAKIEGAQQSK